MLYNNRNYVIANREENVIIIVITDANYIDICACVAIIFFFKGHTCTVFNDKKYIFTYRNG